MKALAHELINHFNAGKIDELNLTVSHSGKDGPLRITQEWSYPKSSGIYVEMLGHAGRIQDEYMSAAGLQTNGIGYSRKLQSDLEKISIASSFDGTHFYHTAQFQPGIFVETRKKPEPYTDLHELAAMLVRAKNGPLSATITRGKGGRIAVAVKTADSGLLEDLKKFERIFDLKFQ